MGQRKVPSPTGEMMIAIAFLCDLINLGVSFITFGLLDWFMDLVEVMVFSLWLSNHGASLWKKNPGLTILATVVDAIPMGDITFPWTVRVAYSVYTEREELQ
jgi:hypothetical protein